MAPSVAELHPEAAPIAVTVKSVPERVITVEAVLVEEDSSVKASTRVENPLAAEAPNVAAVKVAQESIESKPKIRKVIDEEGGTTTASVS
jgi:hypothetical protein